MTETAMVDELPLKILWDRWLTAVGNCPLVRRVARPSLLPHLRDIDAAQVADAPDTLALSGVDATVEQILAGLTTAGSRAVAAGWPAPLPHAPGIVTAPVAGYAQALLESRLAILDLLQGERPETVFPRDLSKWRDLIAGEADKENSGALSSAVWSAAEKESSWVARGILLHLAVHRARPWPSGVGRTARLLMNTLVAAAGHRWIGIPAARCQEYDFTVAVALDTGDAGPFCRLLVFCAED